MPTFETPEPILVTIDLAVGDVRVVASDRADTVVEVRPTNPARKSDVKAAEQTRVEFAGGRLSIKAPRSWRTFSLLSGGESIDVEIGVPSGSELRGDAAVATINTSGRLGACRVKTSAGDIRLDETGPAECRTAAGDISIEHVGGRAEVTTSSGSLHIGRVDGDAIVKNSNGRTWIGVVIGELRVNSANGTIVVDRAHASVVAKTANGDVRLVEVMRGSISAQTAAGKVEIGVHDGVAAWLELNTSFGVVHNRLDSAAQPEPSEETVEIHARTSFGDITVGRVLARSGRTDA